LFSIEANEIGGEEVTSGFIIPGRDGTQFLEPGGEVFDEMAGPVEVVVEFMALQAAMQRRARQVRDGRLQGIEAIVQRQRRVPAEGNDDCLLLDRQHSGLGILRASWDVGHGRPALPFGDGLLVDPVALHHNPQALLTTVSLGGPPLSLWRSHAEPGP